MKWPLPKNYKAGLVMENTKKIHIKSRQEIQGNTEQKQTGNTKKIPIEADMKYKENTHQKQTENRYLTFKYKEISIWSLLTNGFPISLNELSTKIGHDRPLNNITIQCLAASSKLITSNVLKVKVV